MTRKSKLNTTKSRSIFALSVSLLLSCILLLCSACGDTESSKDKDYTKTEKDTAIITNGSFEFGTTSFDLDDYPQTSSLSGWSGISTENSSDSSKVSSGIVNTSDDAWKELVKTLYKDSDFKKYAENKQWIDSEKTDDENHTSLSASFPSPKTHGGDGSKVLMLNNYTNYYKYGTGTAQKTTSSTTITLNKGEFGKLSVWVKTANLQDIDGNKGGANIRLVNTFNSSSQADYAIYGINTDGVTENNGWEEYVIYVKGDANYSTTLKVVLGLGFGNGKKIESDWTEGTAYFDDIVFTEIDETAYNAGINGVTVSEMDYNGKDAIYENASTNSTFAYDMTFNTPANYFASKDLGTFDVAFTTSTTGNLNGYNGKVAQDSSFTPDANNNSDQLKLALNKASVTVTSPEFSVNNEAYNYVSFTIKNELGELDLSGITVYVIDFKGEVKNVTSALTFNEDGEEKTFGIMIKNNFKDGSPRTYKLQIVIGPTNIDDRTVDNYANGTVTISDFKIANGLSYQYVKDSNGKATDDETENYTYYSFFSSVADKAVVLFAGNNKDHVEESDYESYNLSPAPSSYGKIVSEPVNVSGYLGIETDSSYLKSSNTNHTTDKRSGNGDSNGNYAGLINTKYMSGYNNDVKTVIGTSLDGLYKADSNIQPLMIYNATAGAYGYIGKTLTVSPSSSAKISVDVKVVGDAKAYIYLVDALGDTKNIMTFDAFKVNTDGYDYINNGKDVSAKQMEFVVDKTAMDGDWVTVTFYIATGATEKKFRLEMWNGGRDGLAETASEGLIYFNNINVSTSGAFSEYTETEGNSWTGTFYNASSELNGINPIESELHRRVLTETEIKFNKEYSDKAVSYKAKYIWVKSENVIYAVYNTIDPVEKDPYASITEDEEDGSGCTAETDPSTFWLSFSSILLGGTLALALIMLIVKNVARKRKANASDAKSHFKVTSRVSSKKDAKKEVKTVKVEEPEEVEQEIIEEEVVESEEKEEALDDYVYGDVQDFGENDNNEDKE